jgi:hypothetical protein
METTTIILIVAAGAIILMIYLRFFKKEKDAIIPEQDPRKDEYYDLPATDPDFDMEEENKENDIPEEETTIDVKDEEIEEGSKEFDIPEEEIIRIIPDEEIEQCTDEHEKEMIRINNYFISNGIRNLTGDHFFTLQENILLDTSDEADLYTDIHQIFQITGNRFIAITDLPDKKKQSKDENPKILKGLLGIIECRDNIGMGRLGPAGSKVAAEENDYDSSIRIGNFLLQSNGHFEYEVIELLCNELDKLQNDHVAYIIRSSVYIRINRPARLEDTRTMVDILMNFSS